jgi:hypothetical protein
MFTKEELNTLGIIVSQAPIKGQDAKFIAALLDKIAGLLNQPNVPQDVEVN